MKKIITLAVVIAMTFVLCMTGCGNSEKTDGNAKTAILVVSFGTSFDDNLELTIKATEDAIKEAYPDQDVRRAFTAQIVIDVLKEKGIEVDNVTEALDKAAADGIENLVVVPTHLMNGLEYNDIKAELENYEDVFTQISLGDPLLTSDEDFDRVIAAITDDTKEYDDGQTAICFMGHGTHAESNKVYSQLQKKLKDAGYENYYVGTVEAAPTVEDVLAEVEKGNYTKVVLQPLMLVAGDHANNDMAGDEEDSWKTIFANAGYDVEPVLKGLGQIEAIRAIYVDHAKAAVDALK